MRNRVITHRLLVCAVAVCAALLSPRQVPAQTEQPAAVDTQRLSEQPPETQALFESTWGQDAPERWVEEHNAEFYACAAGKELEDAGLHADAVRTYAELLKPTMTGPQPAYTSPSTTVLVNCAHAGIQRVLRKNASEVADPCAAAQALMDAHLYDEAMKAYAEVLKPDAGGSQSLPQTNSQLEQRKECARAGIQNALRSKLLERILMGAVFEAGHQVEHALEQYVAAAAEARNIVLDKIASAAVFFAEQAITRVGTSPDPFAVARLMDAEDRHPDALAEAQRVVDRQPGLAVPSDLLVGPTPAPTLRATPVASTPTLIPTPEPPSNPALGAAEQGLPVLLLVLLVAFEFAYMARRRSV